MLNRSSPGARSRDSPGATSGRVGPAAAAAAAAAAASSSSDPRPSDLGEGPLGGGGEADVEEEEYRDDPRPPHRADADDELESLFRDPSSSSSSSSRPPRPTPRESLRRAAAACGAVSIGCAAFAYGSVRLRGMVRPPPPYPGPPRPIEGVDDDDGGGGRPPERPPFRVSDAVNDEFVSWSEFLRDDTGLSEYSGGVPDVKWDWHPRDRDDRFPSSEERIRYYMGEFYNSTSPMYGTDFLGKVWALRRSTRKFDISSSFTVNLFDFSKDLLLRCHAEESTVLHAYCRDYVDFALLHTDCASSAVWHMGDSLPKTSRNKANVRGYPVVNKVRNFCVKLPHFEDGDLNPNCKKRDMVSTVLWPLNRHRHFTPAARIGDADVPWDEKEGRMIWRGGMNDAFGAGRKWTLVSQHVNSTLVDAKFAMRHNERGRHGDRSEGIPDEYLGPFVDQETQLRYKYMVSIEGNDVSSGLKWMLFSNSLVFLPPTTFESWAMEGLLKPFVHYVPLKSDMSNVEDMIRWAESNPEEAEKIAQRSTLFIYDLLFHPDALRDEQRVLRGMVERYEGNFGCAALYPALHPLSHVHEEWHPAKRADRFPSPGRRVEYCMGGWFGGSEKVSMARDAKHPATSGLDYEPRMDSEFVASGDALRTCADGGDGSDGDGSGSGGTIDPLIRSCREALPFFDDGIVHDIVSTRHPDEDPSFRLAPETDGMTKSERKWFKRILIDDTYKVVRFGDGAPDRTDLPVFSKARAAPAPASGEKTGKEHPKKGGGGAGAILWPFDERREFDLARSGLVERLDGPFASKSPRAVWRGGIGSLGPSSARSPEFLRRADMVRRSIGPSGGTVDARFVPPTEDGGEGPVPVPEEMVDAEGAGDGEEEGRVERLRRALPFRYIVATEDDYRINADLKWMLLSQSVVLMPRELRFTSWFMEDLLEPYVHFVPIEADYTDVEDKVAWCEEHLSDAERISERATLYVHDMLFHRESEGDNSEVMLQIMERYGDLYGG